MNKKQKQAQRSRDAPIQNAQKRESISTAWACSPSAFTTLIGNGYTKLSDCPEVQICVDIYADLISSMTLYLMQNTSKGDVRIRNALSAKVDISPNKHMTRKQFVYTLVRTLMLEGDGNQVTYPRFTPDGLLDNLEPLKPSRVSFRETPDGYEIKYGQATFSPDEVLHFVINPDTEQPWRGTGYRATLKDVVKGLKQAGATKQTLLESPSPSLIVKVDGLTEEFANKEGRAKLLAQYMDSTENGKPWMIPAENFNVQTVKPLTLNDLALAQNMELDKRTAASIFRMPPFMVGVGEYKKDAFNNFINTGIMPKAQVIQQVLTKGLLYSPDLYWRFNPRSLYAYDIGEIISAGKEMVDRMAMRRNQWRDWLGMEPDDDMEELLALENYIPASMLGKQKKLIDTGTGGDGNE